MKRKTAERSSQEFEAFVTETADPLFRSGYRMTAKLLAKRNIDIGKGERQSGWHIDHDFTPGHELLGE